MAKYLKVFDTRSEYEAFTATTEFVKPNVSVCKDQRNIVHFHSAPSHDYVEIGGIKWATMNIGANSITDTGLYFQWGDTSGYTTSQVGTDKVFNWESYKYGNGTSSPGTTGMTKYNSTDGKTVLDINDDAAQANWGGSWRMPTTEELQTLGTVTTSAWTSSYEGSGVAGLILTSNSDSSKKLFFPACGNANGSNINNVGSYGNIWSSSVNSNYVAYGFRLLTSSSNVDFSNYTYRYIGLPVRAILDE